VDNVNKAPLASQVFSQNKQMQNCRLQSLKKSDMPELVATCVHRTGLDVSQRNDNDPYLLAKLIAITRIIKSFLWTHVLSASKPALHSAMLN
jgi:hypothetical protein